MNLSDTESLAESAESSVSKHRARRLTSTPHIYPVRLPLATAEHGWLSVIRDRGIRGLERGGKKRLSHTRSHQLVRPRPILRFLGRAAEPSLQ